MKQYRIFISYSHDDHEQVDEIVRILQANAWIKPILDKDFAPGRGFHEQIKEYIAHAHIFMPIITEASSHWVHQEIGYAMALNITVLPVAIGTEPGEMLYGLHAIVLKKDNKSPEWENALSRRLTDKEISSLLRRNEHEILPLYECAEFQEDRTMMMVRYATLVRQLDSYGIVRQKGALSSFHIPDKPINDPAWELRYQESGDLAVKSSKKPLRRRSKPFLCKWQLRERLILQEHAFEEGCRLIIDPTIKLSNYSNQAMISRLKFLLGFINSFPKNKELSIAIDTKMESKHNLTIVGDWFAAEAVSVSPKGGYIQTIFTRHAPAVQEYIENFDMEFKSLVERDNNGASRDVAATIIEGRIQELTALIDLKKKTKK